MIKILFFGALRDAAGCAEMHCALPAHVGTPEALRDWLAERDPILGEAVRKRGVRVIRDHAFCAFDDTLADASEVAFVSPLSGG